MRDGGVSGEQARVARRVRAVVGQPAVADELGCSLPSVAEPATAGTGAGSTVASSRPGVPSRLLARWTARTGLRWEPSRRSAAALGIAVIIAAVATVCWVIASRPQPVAVASTGVAPKTSAAQSSAAQSSAVDGTPLAPAGSPAVTPAGSVTSAGGELLVVDVAGKVRRPGIYRLPAGSRVDDALRAAGGAQPGVSTAALNLAARLSDGEQIVVSVPGLAATAGGAPGAPGTAGPSSGSQSDGSATVSLNSATLEQLESLPGVGPVLGQHILDWRAQHGRFTSVDQLRDVSGIGEVKFAALKPRVTL